MVHTHELKIQDTIANEPEPVRTFRHYTTSAIATQHFLHYAQSTHKIKSFLLLRITLIAQ